MPSNWPTDAQRKQWDNLSAAAKDASGECDHLTGMARSICIAEKVQSKLSED